MLDFSDLSSVAKDTVCYIDAQSTPCTYKLSKRYMSEIRSVWRNLQRDQFPGHDLDTLVDEIFISTLINRIIEAFCRDQIVRPDRFSKSGYSLLYSGLGIRENQKYHEFGLAVSGARYLGKKIDENQNLSFGCAGFRGKLSLELVEEINVKVGSLFERAEAFAKDNLPDESQVMARFVFLNVCEDLVKEEDTQKA